MDDKRDRGNSDGMSLIEVITVMLILMALTAMITPSLMGFVDKAREQQYVAEAQSVRNAIQMFITEQYAAGTLDDHKTMTTLLNGQLTSNNHVLYPYLKTECSPGAKLTGATVNTDSGALLEIVYQVDACRITLNEDGVKVEEASARPHDLGN